MERTLQDQKLTAEITHLVAETQKLISETRKTNRETTYYPLVVGATLTLAIVAVVKLFL